MTTTDDVLLVSKPLVPPWQDSATLLPCSLAQHASGVRMAVMTRRGLRLDLPGVRSEGLYRHPAEPEPSGFDKARVLARLLGPDIPPVLHFMLAPRRRTSAAAALVRRRHPRVRIVQTVMWLPDFPGELEPALFGDVVAVWSQTGAAMARQALSARQGVRIVHIPPGVSPLEPMGRDEKRQARVALDLSPDRPVVVYAGDVELSGAARVVAMAATRVVERIPAFFVFACRPRTAMSWAATRAFESEIAPLVGRGHARVVGRLDSFHDLLRCADCQVLPGDTMYGRTDLPLSLLEGLSASVPAVVGTGTPVDMLIDAGAVLGVRPADPVALADTLIALLHRHGSVDALAAAGRDWVLRHHGVEQMAAAYSSVYHDLLRM